MCGRRQVGRHGVRRGDEEGRSTRASARSAAPLDAGPIESRPVFSSAKRGREREREEEEDDDDDAEV